MKKILICFSLLLCVGCGDLLEKAHNASDSKTAIKYYQKVKELSEEDKIALHSLYMQNYPEYIEEDAELTDSTILSLQYQAKRSSSNQSNDEIEVDENGKVTKLEDIEIQYDGDVISSITYQGKEIDSSFDKTFQLYCGATWSNKIFEDDKLVETDSEEEGIVKYSYHDNGNGRVLECSLWKMKEDSTYTWTYTYEEGICTSKSLSSRQKDLGTFIQYTYDEEGRVRSETQYSNLINLDYCKEYTYSYDDHLKCIKITTQDSSMTIQYDTFEEEATILDDKNEQIGEGWHIPQYGWIYVCNN